MSYKVKIVWQKADDEVFIDNKYSRAHRWMFDGAEVVGSASPHVVPAPMSLADAVDPEEAFVASLASCHMLWFLSLAAGRGVIVNSYEDNAEGILAKNADGNLAMTRVTLRPQVEAEDAENEIAELHHAAHQKCYIANSVTTEIIVEPQR